VLRSSLNKSLLFFVVIPLVSVMAQRNVHVRTVEELRAVLKKAVQGTNIILSAGDYDFKGELNISLKARGTKPIVIRAENRGKSNIVNESSFLLTAAEHIVIEGLNFISTNGPAVKLCGCSYVQITRNTFHLRETKRGSWILIDGIEGDSVRLSHHNRIDYNIFEKKSQPGNFISIGGTIRTQPQVSQYDRIDHNLFADTGPRVENGMEAIRAGSSLFWFSSGFTIIEDNLFERCDGDPEYITIKSCDDTIRYNTFRECFGSLSLRRGNRNTVEGNYILGNGRTGTFLDNNGKSHTIGTGGVRFYGMGMRIINNYFEGCTGKNWDATCAIPNGNAETGDLRPITMHYRIQDALIADNTLVNNVSNIEIGFDGGGFQNNWWGLAPRGLHFQNNIIVGAQDTLIKMFTPPIDSHWENNIAWATAPAVVSRSPIEGIRAVQPKIVKDGEIWRLSNQSLHSRPLERKDVGPDVE